MLKNVAYNCIECVDLRGEYIETENTKFFLGLTSFTRLETCDSHYVPSDNNLLSRSYWCIIVKFLLKVVKLQCILLVVYPSCAETKFILTRGHHFR